MGIAVIGGAFNPPHLEHINMAYKLLEAGYEKIVFLPSNNPPHKFSNVAFKNRKEMLEIATTNQPRFEISDYEALCNKIHYTCDTLVDLINVYGKLSFVMGGDSLINLQKWKNPEQIIKLCKIIVFIREGRQLCIANALKFWRDKGADIEIMNYCPKGLSSTAIRYAISCGIYDGIDEDVANYIKANNLYSMHKTKLEKLRQNINQNTFDHSIRTWQFAFEVNEKCNLGIDNDQIFLAGMFHDCAKKLCREAHDTSRVPKDSINSAVEHQFLGSIIAKNLYEIDDIDILDAICFHTTGKPNMSKLQKLIYCADMLEKDRNFEGISQLRQIIMEDFEKAFRDCLQKSFKFIQNNNKDIYPLTLEAMDYYKEN